MVYQIPLCPFGSDVDINVTDLATALVHFGVHHQSFLGKDAVFLSLRAHIVNTQNQLVGDSFAVFNALRVTDLARSAIMASDQVVKLILLFLNSGHDNIHTIYKIYRLATHPIQLLSRTLNNKCTPADAQTPSPLIYSLQQIGWNANHGGFAISLRLLFPSLGNERRRF
jgi:hypothetical protein